MTPLNGMVFVKRDPMEKAVGGIEVSEKALTKSYTGVISFSESDKNVTIGDRIHLPHYRVAECELDGVEYAMIKDEEIFAVEEENGFRPLNGYVKVRKCVNDHIRGDDDEVVLYMTDDHIEKTNWVEIIDVSEDCDSLSIEDIGSFCIAPENHDKLRRLLNSKDFMMHESLIEFTAEEAT